MEHSMYCPMHEDSTVRHVCDIKKSKALLTQEMFVEWYQGKWLLKLSLEGVPFWQNIDIRFCPFCGDELDIVTCKCTEIRQGSPTKGISFKPK